MLVLKRDVEMKADYFFFLLSLLGDSMFKWKFDSNLISKAPMKQIRNLVTHFIDIT